MVAAGSAACRGEVNQRQASAHERTPTLEMRVYILECQALGEHEYLEVIEQLANLFSALGIRLVLGGHPYLGGLLHDLLSDRVDAGVEARNSVAPLWAGDCLRAEFREQVIERLHLNRVSVWRALA